MAEPPDDQKLAKLRDSLPRVWWSLYQGSRDAGFSPAQAFTLLRDWILSQGSAPLFLPGTPKQKEKTDES